MIKETNKLRQEDVDKSEKKLPLGMGEGTIDASNLNATHYGKDDPFPLIDIKCGTIDTSKLNVDTIDASSPSSIGTIDASNLVTKDVFENW